MMANPKNGPEASSSSFFCVVALLVVMMFVGPNAPRQETQQDKEARTSLEVRVTSPPRWEKGCLLVTLDRINHSASPLFLTETGPYFDIALDVSSGEAGRAETVEWVNIYGNSDMVSSEAVPLAPGATVHNKFCFGPTVWVVNLKKQTRREIPVRGRLRVSVFYFPTVEALDRYKDWQFHPPAYLEPGKPHEMPAEVQPNWKRIFAAIPCSDATCKSDCSTPPMGVSGEDRPVPDVGSFIPEWNDRGKLLTDELARKFPPCSEDKSIPR
jgi:hypothetical protein